MEKLSGESKENWNAYTVARYNLAKCDDRDCYRETVEHETIISKQATKEKEKADKALQNADKALQDADKAWLKALEEESVARAIDREEEEVTRRIGAERIRKEEE